MKGIFSKLESEYRAAMDQYTKGTGGGPGAPENFAAWKERDETNVIKYSQQASNIYLSVVHMWDKMFQFPFVRERSPMPEGCVIDDACELVGMLEGDHGSESGFESDNRGDRATGKRSRCKQASSEFNPRRSQREHEMGSALARIDSVLETQQRNADELLRIIRGDVPAVVVTRNEGNVTPTGGSTARALGGEKSAAMVVKEIAETKAIISSFESDLERNKQDKLEVLNAPEQLGTAKRLRSLERRAVEVKTTLKALRMTLHVQTKELDALVNFPGEKDDEVEDSDDSE